MSRWQLKTDQRTKLVKCECFCDEPCQRRHLILFGVGRYFIDGKQVRMGEFHEKQDEVIVIQAEWKEGLESIYSAWFGGLPGDVVGVLDD